MKKPTDTDLYTIYLDEGLYNFCEYGGLSEEGKLRALVIWNKRNLDTKPKGRYNKRKKC